MNIIRHMVPSRETLRELPRQAVGLGISAAGVYFTCKLLTTVNPAAATVLFVTVIAIKTIAYKIINSILLERNLQREENEREIYPLQQNNLILNGAAFAAGYGVMRKVTHYKPSFPGVIAMAFLGGAFSTLYNLILQGNGRRRDADMEQVY